jgi:hypothetical protein
VHGPLKYGSEVARKVAWLGIAPSLEPRRTGAQSGASTLVDPSEIRLELIAVPHSTEQKPRGPMFTPQTNYGRQVTYSGITAVDARYRYVQVEMAEAGGGRRKRASSTRLRRPVFRWHLLRRVMDPSYSR